MSITKALEFLTKTTNEILLASGSARRLEILRSVKTARISQLPIPESVENMDFRNFESPQKYTETNVSEKLDYALEHIADRIQRFTPAETPERRPEQLPALVIAADTVVVDGTEVLEKPQSVEHNYQMIKRLGGTEHLTLTAVSFVLFPGAGHVGGGSLHSALLRRHTFCVSTKVKFMALSEETARWYATTGEGRDRAGGYTLQGLGSLLMESVNGDFYNILGFPIHQFAIELNAALLQMEKHPEELV